MLVLFLAAAVDTNARCASGYLVLRGFAEKNQREVWRDAFWRHMRWDRDDPATPWCDDDSAEQRGESVGFLTSPLLYRWPKLMAVSYTHLTLPTIYSV